MQQSCSFFFFRCFGWKKGSTWIDLTMTAFPLAQVRNVHLTDAAFTRTWNVFYSAEPRERDFRGPMWEVGYRRDLKHPRSLLTQRKSSECLNQAHALSSGPCLPPLSSFPSPSLALQASFILNYIHHVLINTRRLYPCLLYLDCFPHPVWLTPSCSS